MKSQKNVSVKSADNSSNSHPKPSPKKIGSQWSTVKRVLKYLRSYRLTLFASFILAAASVIMTLYVPILIGRAIDCMLGKGKVNFDAIVSLLIEVGVLIVATALSQWLMNVCNNRITYGVVRDIRRDAFRKVMQLPLSYLDAHPAGETVSRMIADADTFADGLLMGFTQLFTGVITIIGTLIFMVSIKPLIALVVVLVTPLSLFAAKFIASRTYSMFRLQSETRGEQTAFIEEMISGQKTVQAFGRERENCNKFDEINDRLAKCSLRAIFFSSTTNPVTRFVNSIVYALVALTGALAVISNPVTFTVGSLSCFLSYANQYTKPFNEISGVITELQNAIACAARVLELIEETPQAPDKDSGNVLENPSGEVNIEHVYFSYTADRKLIEDFNLHVKPGQRIAIVGPTGCGKTTLINLLMRFYDVNSGKIEIDGKNTADVTRHSLRSSFGMVLQDTWIKTGTVRENIAIGKPDATDGEIVAAAKTAHAHGFIKRLPNGYDTVISGEAGLSAGQRQLLCIARIMLCLPPMLILDEATSSIDTRTEQKIQLAFAELMKGRTSFIVAHRLSTIREADVILVMRDGHIIEQGKHDDLLSRGGFYSELYNSQFRPSTE